MARRNRRPSTPGRASGSAFLCVASSRTRSLKPRLAGPTGIPGRSTFTYRCLSRRSQAHLLEDSDSHSLPRLVRTRSSFFTRTTGAHRLRWLSYCIHHLVFLPFRFQQHPMNARLSSTSFTVISAVWCGPDWTVVDTATYISQFLAKPSLLWASLSVAQVSLLWQPF